MKLLIKLLFNLIIILNFINVHGQEKTDTTYWKKALKLGLNFNQASFSSNWTGGGVNSLGLNTTFNYLANYRKGNKSWDNEIDLAYGIIKRGEEGSRKSVDRIFIDTKYGIQLSDKWNLYFAGNLLSQFTDGFNYDVKSANGEVKDSLISTFFAPAFVTFSIGVEMKPTDFFKIRISPISPRFTIVANDKLSDLGAYGVDPGEHIRNEYLAFQFTANFEKEIATNLNLKWRYLLFLNYQDPSFDQWDQRLDISFNAKVNSFLVVNLGSVVFFDSDQIDEVQLNQFFNLGLTYVIKNYEDKK